MALLGKEILWPGRHGEAGLIFMYGAICASLVGLFAQLLSATALVTGVHSISQQHGLLHFANCSSSAFADAPVSEGYNAGWPAWEEGREEQGEEAQSLLGKTEEKERGARRRSTVAVLLAFSAQDTPLLLLAFLAGGWVADRENLALCMATRLLHCVFPLQFR